MTSNVLGGGRKATRITITIAVSIWLLAILCAIPSAIGTHVKHFSGHGGIEFYVCYPYPDDWLEHNYHRILILFRFLILYVIPLTIICIFYLGMAVYLFLSTRNVPGELQGMQRQVKAARQGYS